MMAELINKNLPILEFTDQGSFEKWLAAHPGEPTGIWLKIGKKDSGITTISYDQAVESALCFGWIDSQVGSFDQLYYLQKFSPRRAKSKWSRLNCEKAEELIRTGRMQPAGYRQVELAKADGRWKAAYDPQSQITIPDDFQRELDKNKKAQEFFLAQDSHNRYAILHRIQDARKDETRAARIHKFVTMLANKEKIYP